MTLDRLRRALPFKNSLGRRPQLRTSSPPLSDNRYRDLLAQASAFFSEAETDSDALRRQVIEEIQSTMQAYGITVEDLV